MSQGETLPRKNKIVTEVDDFGRKKFILQEDSESDPVAEDNKLFNTGRHASTLIGRDEKIGIQKYIGKLENNKKDKKTEVFYCQVCKIGFKCDLAYITHVNSVSHNRKLGMNMKVEAASLDDVSQKLASLKGKPANSKKYAKMEKLLQKQKKQVKKQQKYFDQFEQDEQIADKNKKEAKLEPKKEEQKVKAEERDPSQENQEEEEEEEDEMMKIMGFSAFGTKKKKY